MSSKRRKSKRKSAKTPPKPVSEGVTRTPDRSPVSSPACDPVFSLKLDFGAKDRKTAPLKTSFLLCHPKRFPKHPDGMQNDAVLFMNAQDLLGLGLCCGTLAFIASPSGDAVCAAMWPYADAPIGTVFITPIPYFLGKRGVDVEIRPCSNVRPAPYCKFFSSEVLPISPIFRTYVHQICLGKVVCDGAVVTVSCFGKRRKLSLGLPTEEEAVSWRITNDTELIFSQPDGDTAVSSDAFEVGGLTAQKRTLRRTIGVSLHPPAEFRSFGIRAPRGVLLYGPSGTGKSLLAKWFARTANVPVFEVSASEIVDRFVGESEKRLKDVFVKATKRAPSIIILDGIEALAPSRQLASGDVESRVVGTLLALMDGLDAREGVAVIAISCAPERLDSAMRRPGRLDVEIETGVPNPAERLAILKVLLRDVSFCGTEEELSLIASKAHGFVGADLMSMVKEAAVNALKRSVTAISLEDLRSGLAAVHPSALREVVVEVPKTYWSDIGGQEDVKQRLKEAVEWPLQHPNLLKRMGLRPLRGVLLYGPPGCSKTMMARALATESGMNFIAVKGPELFSKWVGESEQAIASTFRRARTAAPTVVFFDEIDAIAVARGGDAGNKVGDRVLSQLLQELDGIQPLSGVVVIAATNRPDVLDPALLRPGRLDRLLYVGPPTDDATRAAILKVHLTRTPLAEDVSLEEIASLSKRFSGAELASVCHEAALLAVEEFGGSSTHVFQRHLLEAVGAVQPQITDEVLEFYSSLFGAPEVFAGDEEEEPRKGQSSVPFSFTPAG